MKARLILAPLFIALLLLALWIDSKLQFAYASFTILIGMGTLGAVEWARIMKSGPATYAGLLVAAALLYPLLEGYRIREGWPAGTTDFAFLFAFVFALFLQAVLAGHVEDGLDRVARTLLGFALLYLFYRLGTVLLTFGLYWAYCLVLTSKSCDIGAYVTGRAIGRRKLIPKVSPGKTVAGAVGGITLSTLVGSLFVTQADLGTFGFGLLFGVVLGAVTLLSDLAESLIKRCVKVKDSAILLPEMGGVLDLIDSLILAAPAGYVLLLLR
jgi:phosphatidate cytidylyltransferase